MVGPARKREAVSHLQRSLELSELRVCKVVGQPRNNQRCAFAPDNKDDLLRKEFREISLRRLRVCYRMACARGGWRINNNGVKLLSVVLRISQTNQIKTL